jgi:hypothetical protein
MFFLILIWEEYMLQKTLHSCKWAVSWLWDNSFLRIWSEYMWWFEAIGSPEYLPTCYIIKVGAMNRALGKQGYFWGAGRHMTWWCAWIWTPGGSWVSYCRFWVWWELEGDTWPYLVPSAQSSQLWLNSSDYPVPILPMWYPQQNSLNLIQCVIRKLEEHYLHEWTLPLS